MHSVTSNAVAGTLLYSTIDEINTGKILSGKPIYRKVFNWCNSSTLYQPNDVITVNLGLNIDCLIKADIITIGNNYNNEEVNASWFYEQRYNRPEQTFTFICGVIYQVDTGLLILEYTKV